MLINATEREEIRVAIVDGQQLFDLDIEIPSRQQKKSNIYKGKITRVEPSLEAAFIDYGADRHGFLPLKEISRSYFSKNTKGSPGRANIRDAVREGQELIVQVEKEERGNKGAALTTFISLPGRYLVLMPNNPRAGGVSRRIEGDDRTEIREAMAALDIPQGMGLIVRTAGVGRNTEDLQWDMDYLIQLWTSINQSSTERSAPFLIYQESNVIIRAIRDYLRSDVGEILIDKSSVFDQARDFMHQVMPQYIKKVKFYEDDVPLFTRFQIESQIDSAFNREVSLPSGGAIVIDHTEALTAIDINSARATKGADIEETARNTNLEAADEIGRQLRLRDLGGLIVIDFIDMLQNKNQRDVENRMRDAVKQDRARVQIGRISRFGLLEMSRQRLRPSLGESTHHPCPRCDGQGVVRSIESLALSILRLIEEEAIKENTDKVITQVPVSVATFLINEKRKTLSQIEDRHKTTIQVIPNLNIETPTYEIERIRKSERDNHRGNSYAKIEQLHPVENQGLSQPTKAIEEPAVKRIQQTASPAATEMTETVEDNSNNKGFIQKIVTLFSKKENSDSDNAEQETASSTETAQPEPQNNQNRNRNNQNRGQNNRNQNNRNRNNNNRNRNNQNNQNNDQDNQGSGQSNQNRNQDNQNRGQNNQNRNQDNQNRGQNNQNRNQGNQNRGQNNQNRNQDNQNREQNNQNRKQDNQFNEQGSQETQNRNSNNRNRNNRGRNNQNRNEQEPSTVEESAVQQPTAEAAEQTEQQPTSKYKRRPHGRNTRSPRNRGRGNQTQDNQAVETATNTEPAKPATTNDVAAKPDNTGNKSEAPTNAKPSTHDAPAPEQVTTTADTQTPASTDTSTAEAEKAVATDVAATPETSSSNDGKADTQETKPAATSDSPSAAPEEAKAQPQEASTETNGNVAQAGETAEVDGNTADGNTDDSQAPSSDESDTPSRKPRPRRSNNNRGGRRRHPQSKKVTAATDKNDDAGSDDNSEAPTPNDSAPDNSEPKAETTAPKPKRSSTKKRGRPKGSTNAVKKKAATKKKAVAKAAKVTTENTTEPKAADTSEAEKSDT
ncbi:MAG: Rne/Rng family ribonuclease [Methylococcales bacterium]|nr:Rne/Rng family ribonuclease [Methylococcales bacterium]MBT7444154.1 Rne/Rng family ribonuclease [Methylococcales bacterium]